MDIYRELYNKIISEKTKLQILEYSYINKNYKYIPYSHNCSSNALDNLANLVIDNFIFYAYDENEIIKLNNNMEILKDLRVAARYAYAQRMPKRLKPDSDGTLGEVLLDLLIQVYNPLSKKLIARAKFTEINSKTEITGYDSLYFTKLNNEITLWLGQAKAGSFNYCMSDIQNDLNNKFNKSYFSNTMFYIADRSEPKEIITLIDNINKICFEAQTGLISEIEKQEKVVNYLKEKEVKIKIPCLVAYTKDLYFSDQELSSKIKDEMNNYVKKLDDKIFNIDLGLDYKVVFYIFPVKDVKYVRQKIVEIKK